MLLETFSARVKQGDIDSGCRLNSGKCPVAHALIRRGWADPTVGAGNVLMTALGPGLPSYDREPLPIAKYTAVGLQAFVTCFDGDVSVKPVTLNFVLYSEAV